MNKLREICRKKINNIKRINIKQLVILLFVLAWFLISTYAWFTSNTFVKVESLEINVQTSDGLQISVDAVNWKTVLTRDDIITGEDWAEHLNHISENDAIKPVSTIGETTSEGLLRMFYGKLDFDFELGQLALATREVPDELSTKEYIAFNVFLKAEQPLDISLAVESTVISIPNSNGFTKGLENSIRVAFVNEGSIDSRAYRTPSGVNYIRGLHTAQQVVIWEPNSDSHTVAAISNAFNSYGVSIGAYDVITSYSGVKNVTKKPIHLKNTNFINEPDFFGEIKASNTPNASFNFIQTPKPLKNEPGYKKGQELYYMNVGGDGVLDNPANLGIKLQPGVIKLRIYIWIEGQDYDCEDFAPGTDLQFNLSFSGER